MSLLLQVSPCPKIPFLCITIKKQMSEKNIKSTNTISIDVSLNEDKHPVAIHWNSTANPEGTPRKESKAMLLSLFDKDHLDTYKIDLWTSEMQVAEMDRFMFQTLKALSDTYFKATRNQELANDMQRFVQYFGEETEIVTKEE
ncbi:MAG: gliding motility-associated protein GldC [Saprospiraceae bacterium]